MPNPNDPYADLEDADGPPTANTPQQLRGKEVVGKEDPYKDLYDATTEEKENLGGKGPLWEDWLKSLSTGYLTKGMVANTVGLPGNIESLAKTGANKAMDYLGTSEDTRKSIVGTKDLFPTSQDILDTLQKHAPNLVHKPETTGGEYLDTMGQFMAPSAVFGRTNLARNLLGGAVAGAGSETAGQVTRGTPLEPYARVAGSLVAPVGSKAMDIFANTTNANRDAILGAIAAAPSIAHGELGRAFEHALYGGLGGGTVANAAINQPHLQAIARYTLPTHANDRETMLKALLSASPSIATNTKTKEDPYKDILYRR